MTDLDEADGADGARVMGALMAFAAEEAEKEGAGWPKLSAENLIRAGQTGTSSPTSSFCRTRTGPCGIEPARTAPTLTAASSTSGRSCATHRARSPELKREFYNDWRDSDSWGRILEQDFENLAAVQQGMKSQGFPGSRPSPKQEVAISNLYRVLHEYYYNDIPPARGTRVKAERQVDGRRRRCVDDGTCDRYRGRLGRGLRSRRGGQWWRVTVRRADGETGRAAASCAGEDRCGRRVHRHVRRHHLAAEQPGVPARVSATALTTPGATSPHRSATPGPRPPRHASRPS